MVVLEHNIASIMKPDYYSNGGSGYKISSIYFDDLGDTCLRDTIDGVDERNKYRIRIYNDSFDVIKLEVKMKKYNRINKISSSITKEQLNKLMRGEVLPYSSESGSPNAIQMFNYAIATKGLRPKVIVTYNRAAYVCDMGNVRITFDRNLRTSSDVDLFGNPDLTYEPVITDEREDFILEVKYDDFLPSYIAQVLEMGLMHQMSYSKYGLCREYFGDCSYSAVK